jgi:hypothetical protein
MFKQTSASNELVNLMNENLFQKEANSHVAAIDSAFDCLTKAADLFDDIGLSTEAEVVTRIIEKLAKAR